MQRKKMIDWLEANGKGCDKVNYKLRDWVFSRQRYWGEPIPMVKCEKCGWQPLPESSLPLTLPDITDFEPGPDGESPLARHKDWVKTTCPCCGGPATRETDTMPQWAGSSWYFLRYMDPPLQGCHCFQGSSGILVSGGLVQRRHGAHHPASAVQPFLA